jgi:hypothetical protein
MLKAVRTLRHVIGVTFAGLALLATVYGVYLLGVDSVMSGAPRSLSKVASQ